MYDEYYKRHGSDRNDLLSNPEVLFQTFAIDRANISALRTLDLDRSTAKVLDVGCGAGSSLFQFVRLGFNAQNLTGVDNSAERIEEARHVLPTVTFHAASAESLPFEDSTFDLVFESTMLGTLESQSLLQSIAREMIRVCKSGGYIMLADWRYSKKGSGVKTAISKSFIERTFKVGETTRIVSQTRGALVPPVGRRLSRIAPSLYFLAQTFIPPAAAQVTTVLCKSGALIPPSVT
ncbi:MAG TPA: class I SAM-dependent methyltransferase [Gemmatimonadaceae bacterium]